MCKCNELLKRARALMVMYDKAHPEKDVDELLIAVDLALAMHNVDDNDKRAIGKASASVFVEHGHIERAIECLAASGHSFEECIAEIAKDENTIVIEVPAPDIFKKYQRPIDPPMN